MPSRDFWNGARFDGGEAGHYESWFQRANDADGRRAFWIRYTIFAPRGQARAAVGELWAIWFDRATSAVTAVKQVVPLASCSFSRDRLEVEIGESRLSEGALRGSATSPGTSDRPGHTITWDLRYEGGQEPLLLLPEALYPTRLPKAKALVGRPMARFTGAVTVDGEPVALDGWVGSQNHNWGSKHTDRYAWGQVAGFDEDPAAFLECSTARLRLGPVWSPWMSPVVLRLGGETLRWNGLLRAMRARARYQPYDWTIETRGPDGELTLHLWGDAADFVALRYGNPPGGSKICLNSKIARCELTLRRRGKTLVLRSSRAAFEILEDQGPPGVTPVS
ncbi:MAG TPA: hypothetical protein PKU97_11425 [Kofleriaceae bacterium]|nr:hypothetical protein [Kofleriaceae bacterium]